jgi:hypothetical protein
MITSANISAISRAAVPSTVPEKAMSAAEGRDRIGRLAVQKGLTAAHGRNADTARVGMLDDRAR